MKTTTAVGVLGSLAINVLLAAAVATLFSVTPAAQAAQAGKVAHCAAKHAEPVAAPAAPEHAHGGGHLVAVRMGWEAG
jgi:hypothetical protein